MKTTKLRGSRYAVIGLVGVSILLAACSSGGGGEPSKVNTPTSERVTVANTPTPTSAPARQASPSPAAVTEAEIREIRVTLKNNTFPKEIRVKAGSRVVFVVTNQADEKHTFEVPDMDFYKEIYPGQTVRLEWVVPNKKGKWDMGCFLTTPEGIHEDMEGTLIIE